MPNTMSSKKALRQSRRKRSHNLFWKNRVKIVVKDLKDSLQTKGATLRYTEGEGKPSSEVFGQSS